jgi:hypothetical protein
MIFDSDEELGENLLRISSISCTEDCYFAFLKKVWSIYYVLRISGWK